MPDEVEGKLAVVGEPRRAIVAAVASLDMLAGYHVMRRSQHELSDAYFDTPDGRLGSARVALRVRSEDGRDRLTLKGEGRVERGIITRYELEEDWSPEALNRVLEALRSTGVALDAPPDVSGGATRALESLGLRAATQPPHRPGACGHLRRARRRAGRR